MKLELLQDLNESTQYRTRQAFKKSSAREIADHAFMDTLALWILYNEYNYAPVARRYASRTSALGGFNRYSQLGTDLYQTYSILQRQDKDILGGRPADSTLLNRIKFPDTQARKFLKGIAGNRANENEVRQFLQLLERRLMIDNSNYKSVRRLVQQWPNLNDSQRSLVVTRMLQFYRAHANRSELYSILGQLAKNKSYKIDDAENAEAPKRRTMRNVAVAVGAAGAGVAAGRAIGKRLT
jgi:hypothetical protein